MLNMKGIFVSWFSCVFSCFATSDAVETMNLGDIHKFMKQKFDEVDTFLQSSVADSIAEMNYELLGAIQNLHGNMTTKEHLQSELDAIKSSQDSLKVKVEDLQSELEAIKRLQENMTTKEQLTRVEHVVERCSSVDQMADLRVFLTEDECATGTHNCSEQADCQDAALLYKCHCLSGYLGDGFTCEDVDECSTHTNRCHGHANCTNIIGNYTCACLPGFTGDGYNCEPIPCDSPSKLIPSLGCVTLVKRMMSWEEARQYCQEDGTRLLEGITSRGDLDLVKQHFFDLLGWAGVWTGIKGMQWAEEGGLIDPSSSLWSKTEQPGEDTECGGVAVYSSNTYLFARPCAETRYSLCQRSIPRN